MKREKVFYSVMTAISIMGGVVWTVGCSQCDMAWAYRLLISVVLGAFVGTSMALYQEHS